MLLLSVMCCFVFMFWVKFFLARISLGFPSGGNINIGCVIMVSD